jgi:hypothetical protein
MRSEAQVLLQSIMAELAAAGEDRERLEAKSIYRILNYCPVEDGVSRIEENRPELGSDSPRSTS